jgi:hypothetical protein
MKRSEFNNKYWILVASKNHVSRGVQEGIAQACHGKAGPLQRMRVNDGIIYYSPKLEFEKNMICQEFTALGFVTGATVYAHDMGNGFVPYRRDIEYITGTPAKIRPLIKELQFITDPQHWGAKFRFGAFEISKVDFIMIATAMQVNIANHI